MFQTSNNLLHVDPNEGHVSQFVKSPFLVSHQGKSNLMPMENTPNRKPDQKRESPTVSAVLSDGRIVEMVFDPLERRTRLVVWQDGSWRFEDIVHTPTGERLIPYSSQNNLIQKEVVLFPSEPYDYGSEEQLVEDIRSFIHRYVDVSPRFERIACYYVLFSWLYDDFAELPYLRLRGDYGSGKTRFLLTVGSLCYKPIFAGGATSTSSTFRMLDSFRGTLIIDEGDFRYSDEKSDLIKIFNNGNQKGLPVIKTEMSGTKEFNPRAFEVFSPKILASRGPFDDKALESRFLTEETGDRKLRRDIPINLPPTYKDEALALRNKLLLFRFQKLGKTQIPTLVLDERIEPRLRQIFIPLLSIVSSEAVRAELRDVVWRYHQDLRADRAMEVEAQTLEVIRELLAKSSQPSVSIKEVTDEIIRRHGREYERITPKWIGMIIRKRLHLRTHKSSHGVFIISPEELQKLPLLYEKYGVTSADDAIGKEAGPKDHHESAATQRVDDNIVNIEGKTDVEDIVDIDAVGHASQTQDELA